VCISIKRDWEGSEAVGRFPTPSLDKRGVNHPLDQASAKALLLARKMRGLRHKKRKFTRALNGPSGKDQKTTAFNYPTF
jgi:hypothetical protein